MSYQDLEIYIFFFRRVGWAPETEEEQIQMTIYSQILVVHYILQAKRERILHASSIGTPVLSELDE